MVMRFLLRLYDPALDFALRRRKTVLAIAALLLLAAAIVAFGLPRPINRLFGIVPPLQRLTAGMGKEFMPPLNEGSLLFMPTFVPATAMTEVKRVMAWQDRVLRHDP